MSEVSTVIDGQGNVFELTKARPVEELQVPDEYGDAEKAKQLPKPVGYKLLCIVPNIEAKFEGTSIERPAQVLAQEQFATVVLFVLAMGDMAYTDKERYPTGPWCSVGQFVVARQYSGTRLRIHGKELRILNEDQVEAVIDDPRGVTRV